MKVDVSAPYLKKLLVTAFARALSELPREKVVQCWAPLADAYDKMNELHATATQQLPRLFPNQQTYVPGENEQEPDSDVDDDFDTDEGLAARDAEYEAMATAAAGAGVPPRRSGRAGVAAATAEMGAARERERLAGERIDAQAARDRAGPSGVGGAQRGVVSFRSQFSAL